MERVDLSDFDIYPLRYVSVNSISELAGAIRQMFGEEIRAVTPKFHNGSGGAGIEPIFAEDDIESKVQACLTSYWRKLGANANPFPAAIMEFIQPPVLGCFGNLGQRVYDLRCYYSVNKQHLIEAHGGLIRVAKAKFEKGVSREEYITNLSGYDENEPERGFGLNTETLRYINAIKEDLAKVFAGGIKLLSAISNNFGRQRHQQPKGTCHTHN
jgi:hypothetical protein